MALRILWDEEETAILVDYFMQFKNGKVTRQDAISKASKELRVRAVRLGWKIDDIFRNENGITMQMVKIEDLFTGTNRHLSKAPQVFENVVDQYINNRASFDRVLKRARSMNNGNSSVEEKFFNWLSGRISPAQMSELYFAYPEIEKFCLSKNVLKKPIFETTEISVISSVKSIVGSDRVFRFSYKKHIRRMQSAIDFYYKFLQDHYPTLQADKSNITTVEKPMSSLMSIAEQKETGKKRIVSFETLETYAFSKPNGFLYFGDEYVVQNWTQLYVEVIRCLYNDYPQVIKKLCNMGGRQDASVRIVDGLMKNFLLAPKKIKDGLYLETKLNATDIILRVKQLLDLCNIDYKNVVIMYSEIKDKETVNEIQKSVPINERGTKDVLIDYLIKHHVPYTDKRYRGGCLWIKGGHELDNIVKYCKINFNVTFKYTDKGARSLGGGVGWWTNDRGNNTVLKQVRKTKTIPGEMSRSVQEANSSAFLRWLITEQHMEVSIAQGYMSDIHTCGQIAFKAGVGNKRLYGIDYEEAQKTTSLLMGTTVFKKEDRKRNYQLSIAIAKYLLYLSGEKDTNLERSGKEENKQVKASKNEKLMTVVSPDRLYQKKNLEQYPLEKDNKRFVLRQSKEINIPYSNGIELTEELSLYEKILQNNFPKGYRVDSGLDLKRFIRYYSELNGIELNVNEEYIKDKIRNNIPRIGVRHGGYIFSVDSLINTDTKKKLLEYISNCFSQGNKVLYYKALFREFNEEFLGQRIYDESMLRAYLIHECSGQYVFEDSFMSQEKSVEIDMCEEIRKVLISHGAPMKMEELYRILHYFPTDHIDKAVRTNKRFIWNANKEYFDISLIDLSEDELEDIVYVIEQIIDEKKFLSSNELIDIIERKYPDMLERFPQFSQIGLRDAIAYYLKDRFSFSANIISPLHKQLSMGDVFAEFAKTHESFTIDELNVLKNEMNSTIYFDSIYKNSLRVSQRQFVAKKEAKFDIGGTDRAIDAFCVNEYISLAEVTGFGMFPDAGFPWNIYLLQHFVAEYSKKYKLLHTNFAADNCVGAIVKRESKLESFSDLIADVLVHSDIKINRNNALDYLCEKGYLARRRFSDIDKILIRVKARKEG